MESANRNKSFAINAVWSLALQVVNIAVGFFIPHILISSYGSNANGLVTSVMQLVSYLTLVEAGISSAAIFALYKPLANHQLEQVNVVVSAAKKLYYQSGSLFVALSLVLAILYPLVLDCEPMSLYEVSILVLGLCASGTLDFFLLAKYRVLLVASQKNWVIQAATIVYKLLYLMIILELAKWAVPLYIVYIAAMAPLLVRAIILPAYTKRHFGFIRFDADCRGYKIEQRWAAFYIQILGVVQSGFPLIAVTFITNDLTLVSIFSLYVLVANGVQSICSFITNGTQAVIGNVLALNQQEIACETYKEMGILIGVVNASACGVMAYMILPFIALYTQGITDIDYIIPLLGSIASLSVFLNNLKTTQGVFVIAAGKYKEDIIYVTVQTAVLIVGVIVGTLIWSLEGALLGVCLCNVYAAFYLRPFVARYVIAESQDITLKLYISTIMAYLPQMLIALCFPAYIHDWFSWMVVFCIAVIVSLCISLLVFLITDCRSMKLLLRRAKSLAR